VIVRDTEKVVSHAETFPVTVVNLPAVQRWLGVGDGGGHRDTVSWNAVPGGNRTVVRWCSCALCSGLSSKRDIGSTLEDIPSPIALPLLKYLFTNGFRLHLRHVSPAFQTSSSTRVAGQSLQSRPQGRIIPAILSSSNVMVAEGRGGER
jgi:hypothetical protein